MPELTPWQQRFAAAKAKAAAEGRTYFTGRCNCYRGCGSPNSGRCYEGQGAPLFTLPEREGVCDTCWEHCGWAKEAAKQ
jgi:hypothetical protein